jgi:hypothetical protein
MNFATAQAGPGGRRSKREVVDVPEPKVQDRSLDKLIHVRKQRLGRLEIERNEARAAWRAARAELHAAKERWRAGERAAREFWKAARADFLSMATTSGQFRKAKAIYQRLQSAASELYLQAKQAVGICKERRVAFFAARRRVAEANLQQEKLNILRDEIRAATAPIEA